MQDSITIQNVNKSYGKVQALSNVSFTVKRGELFGLIGADGAGKSTLFNILTTLQHADSGTTCIDGYDTRKDYRTIRKIIGYMPGRFSLYQDLTVYENLEFFASIFDGTIEQNYDLIKDIWLQIEPFRTRPAGKLSGGMKQKLALCCALVHKPAVLLLDEPTTGVDPVSRREFWEMLKRLKEKGITILVSTPYMDEASLCERVALIQKGNILTINTPEGITKSFDKPLFAIKSDNIYDTVQALLAFPATHACYAFGQQAHLVARSGQITEEDIHDFLICNHHNLVEIKKVYPSIEDCFIELMQKQTE